MKKLLPIFLISFFSFVTLIYPLSVSAQGGAPAPAPSTTNIPVVTGQPPAPGNLVSPTAGAVNQQAGQTSAAGVWVIDPEVTFTGKNAARSGLLLDWALRNYNWVCVRSIEPGINQNGQCDDSKNPIRQYWSLIVVYIVVPMLFLVILATALVIIITRGRSVTVMRFLPRFLAVIFLIVFSYAIVQFLAQFADVIQGFFLQSNPTGGPCPPNCVSQKDLLYVGWKYETFIGLRLLGDFNAESSFISILLTKLTALTYFVMVILLILRKIILWFFVIVSPIFPILLMYYPTRNTGKIWIGEFFRWLLYAPLFALFLKGLVFMWRNQIPLVFNNPNIGNPEQIIFPTAINILLGGPKQYVTPTNSVNLTETFALYVVALIMLWTVIILPWILLQIFLEYAQNFVPGDSALMKSFMNMAVKKVAPVTGGGGPATSPQGGGAAINLPFAKKFSIPTSIHPVAGPTGAAKAIPTGKTTSETSTQKSTLISNAASTISNVASNQASTSRPTTISNQQSQASTTSNQESTSRPTFISALTNMMQPNKTSTVNLSNVQVPSMRDIAKYETSLLSKDKSKQQSITQASKVLEKIGNPTKAETPAEQAQFTNLRQKLMQQSQQGNNVATSILKAANSVVSSNAQQKNQSQMSTSQVKNVLKQIANPASAPASTREQMTNLHNIMQKESKENHSQLASAILSVTDKTSDQEVQKIHESLKKSTSTRDKVSNSVNSVMFKQSNVNMKMKNALVQVSNPGAVSAVNRETAVKLNQSLKQASTQGNTLAASILSLSDKTPAVEFEKLQEKIMEAKEKGEPIATQITNLAQTQQATSLPATNRVQAVSKQDYQAVKDMWKENYQNLEVPEGLATSRSEWIKDDIASIDQIVGLLSSPDADKVQEGMDKVSAILPFLLVGGFSQTEIVEYLKAKQEAAKEVATSLTAEEETKVTVETKKGHAEQTMAASLEEESSTSVSRVSRATSNVSEEEESPLANLQTVQTTTIAQPQISQDILAMVNIQLPSMRDVAQYEARALGRGKVAAPAVEKVHDVLTKIAAPEKITETSEREQYTQIREKLVEEKQKGNVTASMLLNAAERMHPNPEQAKKAFSLMANPSLATEEDKQRFTKLHEKLLQESQQGNELASEILSTKETTSQDAIEKLSEKLKDASQKKSSLATSIMPHLASGVGSLPTANNVQAVNQEDYQAVKAMWKENYQNLEVPEGLATSRSEWLKDDIKSIDEIIGLLSSSDTEKVQEGMNKVSEILPFLLLGGFSQTEIVSYLQAKQEAAKEVSASLAAEEESQVSVPVQKAEQQVMSQAANIDDSDTSFGTESIQDVTDTTAQVSNQASSIVEMTSPTIKAIAQYEVERLSKKNVRADVDSMHSALDKIVNPLVIADTTEREHFEKLRERLLAEQAKGNTAASSLLDSSRKAFELSEAGKEVSDEEYDEIEKLWEEAYRTLPVPQEFNNDRVAWIKADIVYIREVTDLLASTDEEKKQEGLQKVSEILPFLVLGGFSYQEIVKYLGKKLEAANNVVADLQQEEENQVSVGVSQTEEQNQEMAAVPAQDDTSNEK